VLDEKSIIFKVRYLYGKQGRRCGRHKRDGECALPGEVCRPAIVLLASRGVGMGRQKSAEGIVLGSAQIRWVGVPLAPE
jgi:hypothetical protein